MNKFNLSVIKKRIEKTKTDHKKLMKIIKQRIQQCKKAHKLSMQRIKNKFSPEPKAKPPRKHRNDKTNRV